MDDVRRTEEQRRERMIYGNVQHTSHMCVLLVLCIIRDFTVHRLHHHKKITFETSKKSPHMLMFWWVYVDVPRKIWIFASVFAETEESIADVCQLGQDVCFNNNGKSFCSSFDAIDKYNNTRRHNYYHLFDSASVRLLYFVNL